jgi:hypothetical protein
MTKWIYFWLKTAKFVIPVLDTGIQGYEASSPKFTLFSGSWPAAKIKPDSSGIAPGIQGRVVIVASFF